MENTIDRLAGYLKKDKKLAKMFKDDFDYMKKELEEKIKNGKRNKN